jgi:2-phosphoglycerate kinase
MQSDWQVLLIGGSGGTGKTMVTEVLSQRLRTAAGQVDDFRLVLQQVTSVEEHPALHYFVTTPDLWQQPPERLCERLGEVATEVSKALRIVISHHAVTRHAYILEGDGLRPSIVAQQVFTDPDTRGLVQAVFLFESDEKEIRRNMLDRGRGFDQRTRLEQDVQVRLNWLYGQWLRGEAEAHGLLVLPSRPWETLADRVVMATGSGPVTRAT